jgi:hypothetical protein
MMLKPQRYKDYLVFRLSGSSKDRRKQLKEIKRTYSECCIRCSAPCTVKYVDNVRILVEDANVPRTIVIVFYLL